ncbi:hypothetical protein DI005_04555 [Prauserella sp. PE36]|uniref:hypothetical protein n=1 Tax=Prauserella sp. PE36 TaxID=1504709 RepID=UPI000DE39971|nr:hypothetical protein [Prauserella sp. PE36]RBM22914.1 hypothetical protein DI005_04555 [Prauserella sp. PE36]
MPEGNSLVADAPQDGDGPGPLTSGNGDYGYAGGIGIAESAIDTFNGIKDGNWVEGGLGVLGLAAEGAAAAIDPFGWLMSSVASFLMEHIQPLKDMLDSVCGDPPVIQSYSETWSNVATHLDETKVSFANAVANGTTGWTGAAADSYRESCKEQEETIAGAASVAGSISTVVMIFGEVVSFVRETVRDLIADLVGKLIAWVLETVFSLGFGTPVVVAQAVTAISKWGAKIAELLKKLLETIRKVSPLLGKLGDILAKILKVSGKIAGKVTGLDVINTRNITPGGFLQRGGPDVDTPGGGGSGGGSGSGSGGGSDGGDSGNSGDGSGGDSGDGGSSSDSGSSSSDGEGSGSDTGATTTGTPSTSTRSGSGSDSSSSGNTTDSPGDSSPDAGGDGGSPSSRSSDSPSGSGTTTNSPSSNGGSSTDSPSSYQSRADSPSSSGSSDSPSTTTSTPPAGHSTPNTPGTPSTPDGSGAPSAPHSPGTPSTPSTPDASGTPNTPNTPGTPNTPNTPNPDGGGAPPSSPSPSHSSPSPTPNGGGDSPSGSPSSPGTHTGGGGSGPAPHSGSGGPSPSAHHDSGTSTSASAQPSGTLPRTPDAGPSAVPSQRGPDGGGSSPSGQQGTPVAGGPAGGPGAPGGGGPGVGSPGGRPGASGGWTGTPGSPGAPSPRTPDAPAARPDGPGGRPSPPSPNTPPQAAPRGFGPGGPNSPAHPAPSHHGTPPPGTQPPDGGPSHPNGQPGQHTPDNNGNGGPDDAAYPNTPPHHDPEKLGPDEVNQRHAESTPAGTSFHRNDPEMGDLPHRVQPDPDGRYTADVHVTPDGHARIGNQLYTPEEFADILRRNGDYDGRPIRLIGCDAGSNDFAQRLSRELDTEVLAPNKPAWTDSDGRVFSSDYEVGPDGQVRPRIPPNGEWSVHSPDGSTSRGSDDAFTPHTADADKQDIDVDSAQARGEDHANLDEEWGDYQVHSDDPDFYRPGHADHAPIVDYDRPGRDNPAAGPPDNPYNDPPRSPSSTIQTDMPSRNQFPPKNAEPSERYQIPRALRDHPELFDETGKLKPNMEIPVEYKGKNGEVAASTRFYTDENGDIKWVELTPGRQYDTDADWKDIEGMSDAEKADIKAGTNPDFNHMLPECKYEVDNWRDPDKKIHFETNERAQTEKMSGQPDYGPSNDNYRDQAAQNRAGNEGRDAYKNAEEPAYRKIRWAGGHLMPTEGGGPGGYGNMHGQMAASNSGNARDGWDQVDRSESWRHQEEQIARYAQASGADVELLEVSVPRRTEDGMAVEETMRWRVKDTDPETGEPRVRVFERKFINVPENMPVDDWSKVKHYGDD